MSWSHSRSCHCALGHRLKHFHLGAYILRTSSSCPLPTLASGCSHWLVCLMVLPSLPFLSSHLWVSHLPFMSSSLPVCQLLGRALETCQRKRKSCYPQKACMQYKPTRMAPRSRWWHRGRCGQSCLVDAGEKLPRGAHAEVKS